MASSDTMDSVIHPEIYVAPLQITKDCSRTPSNTSSSSQRTLTSAGRHIVSRKSGQITPPLTPQGSEDDLQRRNESLQPTFQTYLRAVYSFHPTCDDSSSTITLPLNYGDIILIHSVHTNGWADGTLLSSGARGWLPTNYCEAYSNEPARVLLKALTKFWDLAKGSSVDGLEALANQDYVRGLVAGVRCLLVSCCPSGCASHTKHKVDDRSHTHASAGKNKLLNPRIIRHSISSWPAAKSEGSSFGAFVLRQDCEIARGTLE